MVAIYITCHFASYPIGFTIAGYNTAGIIIEKQTGWENLYTTLITSSSVLGLMIGSLLCDKFIAFGRIKIAYIANIIILLSVVPQMWLTLPSLIAGRFIMGFGAGLC